MDFESFENEEGCDAMDVEGRCVNMMCNQSLLYIVLAIHMDIDEPQSMVEVFNDELIHILALQSD